ncbi:hypothetical protein SAMN05192550_3282 [Flavobacterium glycines]|uniref:Uncharacterized protein n=1 Tax=Flavobacterium glycines TaxID=551990 RepID=A0A1B9DTU5_9FLAO|nr:hypothetical protein [Flavobacterium glycines]OCB73118.1 hypothetical protein FBGL_03505 [Flavobacterium glycines]GEL12343.1 hypothetical protein FGL01_30820 [Flavobacterium glycines]SDK07416.1 hypothetical protein SAMN05192550_3282 [Flavobacterium glycines]
MTTTEIGLLSACIGGSAGIFSQIIANLLRDKTDKKKLVIDCLSEERKLAHILFIYARRLEKAIITTEYCYQLSNIEVSEKEREKQSERYHNELKYCGDISNDYNSLLGDYCKNVYKLLMYTRESKKVENILSKIMSQPFDDANNIFEKYEKYPELYEFYSQSILSVEAKLEPYKKLFNDIYKEIQHLAED